MSLNKHSRKNNPLKPKRNLHDSLKFIVISLLLIVLVDYVFFKEERPYITKMKQEYWAKQALKEQALEEALPPKIIFPDDGKEYFEAPELKLKDQQSLLPEKQLNITKIIPKDVEPKEAQSTKIEKPTRKKFVGGKAKIAVVIDDIGMNIKQSKAAINLPSEITLALLPYATSVRDMAKNGQAKGHELIIHTPMEAMSKDIPLGSLALYAGMDKTAFKAEFNKIANSFDGYIGINNHMGSLLTQDSKAMKTLMGELKDRNLFFLDSKTIGTSIAAGIAQQEGIPNAVRDVFLDHEETPEFLTKALKNTERVAMKHGSAIAIGHPKLVTMSALRKWIPTLESRGFELVHLSTLINGGKDTKTQSTKKTIKEKTTPAKKPKEASGEPIKLNFKSPVGELTMEDELVVIEPQAGDINNVGEPYQVIITEPTKNIEIIKYGLPRISYPID